MHFVLRDGECCAMYIVHGGSVMGEGPPPSLTPSVLAIRAFGDNATWRAR